MDCFVASAPRNAGGPDTLYDPAARCARVVHEIFAPRKQRAWGMPGARCSRSPCALVVSTGWSPRSHRNHPAFPHATGYGFLRAPLRRVRLVTVVNELMTCLSPVGPTHLRRLDTSNGCQDHTVLPSASASFVWRAVITHGKPALRPKLRARSTTFRVLAQPRRANHWSRSGKTKR